MYGNLKIEGVPVCKKCGAPKISEFYFDKNGYSHWKYTCPFCDTHKLFDKYQNKSLKELKEKKTKKFRGKKWKIRKLSLERLLFLQ